jgi:hypothetical protein
MAKYSYGIASLKVGDIDPVTGLMVSPLEIKEMVYRDTFNMTEEEGTTTDHYSEMDTTPKVSFTEVGKETLTLQLMETQAEVLQKFLGGTVTTLDGSSAWSKPSGATSIEKFIDIETEDGTRVRIPRAKVTGRKNMQFRRNGIWLIDVTITPLSPLLGTLAAIVINDPV